jgi:predicted O-methyltransferase YrrM
MRIVPSFEEVMQLTATISVHEILEPAECEAMYDTLLLLPDGATVVEVGCDLGRSSSLILQMARAKDFRTIHVDPWQSEPAKAKRWMELASERLAYHPFILLRMTTQEAEEALARLEPEGIDLAFIDGSHDRDVVAEDLRIVASHVLPGGFLTAHDYPSAGVSEAIDSYVASGWTKHRQAAPGFGVWRKR